MMTFGKFPGVSQILIGRQLFPVSSASFQFVDKTDIVAVAVYIGSPPPLR